MRSDGVQRGASSRHWLALRMTRPGLAIVGVCRRSPPGLKPHAHRGEDAGLRVRGLWCFERLIWIGHRDRLENLGHQPLPPAVLPGGRSSDRRRSHPGSCRAKRLCRGGSISEKTARGARDRIGLSAWCGSVSERAAGRSLYRFRGFECGLGALWQPVLRQRAGSTPSSATTTATGLRGAYGIESGLPHPAVRREAPLIAWA